MSINAGTVSVAGYYTFYLNGEPVFEEPSKNLITDSGWNRLLNFGQVSSTITTSGGITIQVGTSNTTPLVTDTTLGAFLAQKIGASSATTPAGSDVNGQYQAHRLTFTFPLGSVVGNIAEVGFKVAGTDSFVTSRSLVKDGLGNPAVVSVTADDQLIVVYEVRYYRSYADFTGTLTIGGVSTNYVIRMATNLAPNYFSGFKPLSTNGYILRGTGAVFGAAGVDSTGGTALTSVASGAVAATVNVATGVVTLTHPTMSIGSGNISGGINVLETKYSDSSSYPGYGTVKAQFTPNIAKDNTKTLAITLAYTFTRL